MFRTGWQRGGSHHPAQPWKQGLGFASLAQSLLEAPPDERAEALKGLSERHPRWAEQLRRYMEQATALPAAPFGQLVMDCLPKETPPPRPPVRDQLGEIPEATPPVPTPSSWRQDLAVRLPITRPPGTIGLLGQPRRSLIWEPESVPVMGTTPPPPGKVTAYGEGSDTEPTSITLNPFVVRDSGLTSIWDDADPAET